MTNARCFPFLTFFSSKSSLISILLKDLEEGKTSCKKLEDHRKRNFNIFKEVPRIICKNFYLISILFFNSTVKKHFFYIELPS